MQEVAPVETHTSKSPRSVQQPELTWRNHFHRLLRDQIWIPGQLYEVLLYKVRNRFLPNVPELTEVSVANTPLAESRRARSKNVSPEWDSRFGNRQQTFGAKEGESGQRQGPVLGVIER